MSLNDTQLQTLATAIKAETNPICVNALAIRDDVAMTNNWVNIPSTQNAWNTSMDRTALFEATPLTKFDDLLDGKRDGWNLLMSSTPVDFSRNKARRAVTDTWDADADGVLASCVRKATNGEKYLGGVDTTEGTVTAWKLAVPGNISQDDVSKALNRY
jgi:hypothetical protein